MFVTIKKRKLGPSILLLFPGNYLKRGFGLLINLPAAGEGYQRGTGSSPGGMGVAPSEDKS